MLFTQIPYDDDKMVSRYNRVAVISVICVFDTYTRLMDHFPLYCLINLVCLQPCTKGALRVGSTVVTAIGVSQMLIRLKLCVTLKFLVVFFQDLEQQLNSVVTLLQLFREKNEQLDSPFPQLTTMERKLDDLGGRWEELQTKIKDRQDEGEREREAALNNELKMVSRQLDALAASTEDLRAISYEETNVLEQRETYEV